MGLAAQSGFDHVFDEGESRRVSGMLEGVKDGSAVAVR